MILETMSAVFSIHFWNMSMILETMSAVFSIHFGNMSMIMKANKNKEFIWNGQVSHIQFQNNGYHIFLSCERDILMPKFLSTKCIRNRFPGAILWVPSAHAALIIC